MACQHLQGSTSLQHPDHGPVMGGSQLQAAASPPDLHRDAFPASGQIGRDTQLIAAQAHTGITQHAALPDAAQRGGMDAVVTGFEIGAQVDLAGSAEEFIGLLLPTAIRRQHGIGTQA